MQFQARALDSQHQMLTLQIDAVDEKDAYAQLAAKALTPIALRRSRSWFPQRKSAFDLLLFAHELHSLLTAGLSVIEALDVLGEKAGDGHTRTVVGRLAQSVRQGERLSTALAAQPSTFPPLFVGIVQAAEGTSDLPRTLGRYIDYEVRLGAVRHRVASAAIYPALLIVVGGAVSLFLLGYVVPRFAIVYQGGSQQLPWASQVLLKWGAFAGEHLLFIGLTSTALLVATGLKLRALWRQGQFTRALAMLPAARERLRLFELSRLYLTLGMLIEGGIPANRAISLCRSVVAPGSAAALDRVRASVESGLPFSQSLDAAGLGTPVAQRLLRVGEQSGQLGTMLSRTAAFYDGETARWIERFTRLFEPVLMAAIGLVIGLIVILLYMPVFDLAGSLQ